MKVFILFKIYIHVFTKGRIKKVEKTMTVNLGWRTKVEKERGLPKRKKSTGW